ncbi:MAG: hypothetical protein ACYTFA_17180, partial [Planctomycetota bacterium]
MIKQQEPYRFKVGCAGILLAACCFTVVASGQSSHGRPATTGTDLDLSRYTNDGGGAIFSTGGDFELSGTIGQP